MRTAIQSELVVALVPAAGFERVGEDAEAAAGATQAVRQLVSKLRMLQRMLDDTLPHADALEMMASAVEAPLAELIDQVRTITDAPSPNRALAVDLSLKVLKRL